MPLVLPMIVAALAAAGAAWAQRLRTTATRWPALGWVALLALGAIGASAMRGAEYAVLRFAAGGAIERADSVRQTLMAFGIAGPLATLTIATACWLVLVRAKLRDEVDPPLAAMVAAAGFVVGEALVRISADEGARAIGVRGAVLAMGEIALAGSWGYGLARSAWDGQLGGTPFGRYALGSMVVRGALELADRTRGVYSLSFMLAISLAGLGFASLGVFRLSRKDEAPPASLAVAGTETIRKLARSQLRGHGVRLTWIALGALANVGGMLIGFAGAVAIGLRAKIDFSEIDRNGPAAEYAALLLVLGVLVSFPFSAAVVGVASGGRNARGRAYVLEAGLAAIGALALLLVALGVVAPVAAALGLACAPVAFVLAGLGAWVAAGRRA
jgi:hypothetical protein